MRGNAAPLACLLAITGAVLTLTACSNGGAGGTESKTAACANMKHQLVSFNVSQPNDLQAAGQAYADAAKRLRAEAGRAQDDSIKTAATRVAGALEGLAEDMRGLAAGKGGVPKIDDLTRSVAELQKACGS